MLNFKLRIPRARIKWPGAKFWLLGNENMVRLAHFSCQFLAPVGNLGGQGMGLKEKKTVYPAYKLFLTALKERMHTDGFILLQTDVLPLFSFYQQLIAAHGAFVHDTTLHNEAITSLLKAKTHREKKCLAAGLTIHRGIFRLKY